jgi:hypothetical protein
VAVADRLLRRLSGRRDPPPARAAPTAALPDAVWERVSPMPGIKLGIERQLALVEGSLARYFGELEGAGGIGADGAYGALDAATLHALVRHHRPARVLQLGAGAATLVVQHAAHANAAEERPLEHVVVDPRPMPQLDALEGVQVERTTPRALPDERFAWLQDGDLLFLDTDHTVGVGADVNRVVLEGLPTLAQGVLVHVHDVFLPFEYPRELAERGVAWQEQYLIQAFLCGNPDWAVLLANHALARLHGERLRRLVPGLDEGARPSAFWLERIAVSAAT